MATQWTTSGSDAIGNADANIRLNPTGGEITLNNTTPADTKIKLKDSSSGAGKVLTIQGSNGASGNNNGGNIILTPGAKTGTGTDGNVGIGMTSPECKLHIVYPNSSKDDTTYSFEDHGILPKVLSVLAGANGTNNGLTTRGAAIRSETHSSLKLSTDPNLDFSKADGANYFKVFLNTDHDQNYSGVHCEMIDKAPGHGDHVGLASLVFSQGNADLVNTQRPSPFQWGLWSLVNNSGYQSNAVGAEINVANSDTMNNSYLDNYQMSDFPSHAAIGIILATDVGIRHATRGLALAHIQRNINGNNRKIGWSTGVSLNGFVHTGIYLNSEIEYENPEETNAAKQVAAEKVGIRFGKDLTSLLRITRGYEERWALTAPTNGNYLSFQCNLKGSIKSVVFYPSNGGTNYAVNDILNIAGGNGGQVQVTEIRNGVLDSNYQVSIHSPGSSYQEGDRLAISGAGTSAAVVVVKHVDGSGSVIEIDFTDNPIIGYGYSLGSDISTTGGHGNGCTVNINSIKNGVVSKIALYAGGSDYSVSQAGAIPTTGGSGTGCTIIIMTIDKTGTDQLVLDNNARVGIGTIIPSEKLTVTDTQTLSIGDGKGNGGVTEIQIKAPAAILLGLDSKINGNEFLRFATLSGENHIQSFEATAGSPTAAKLRLTSGVAQGSDGITVISGGSVGIGTISPDEKLVVNGGASIVTSKVLSGAAGSRAAFKVGRTSEDVTLAVAGASGEWNNSAAQGDTVLRTESVNAKLFLNNTGSGLGMVLNSNNVGIGVTSPGEKLEVSGKIKASNGTNAALNLPILTSDPGTPSTGDLWVRKVTGTPNTYFLKVQTSDGLKAVQLS